MRQFDIREIKNGWIISYYTDEGRVERFFTSVDEIIDILRMVVTTPVDSTTLRKVSI